MNAYRFLKKYVLVLFAVLACVACSDDDNTPTISTKQLLNQDLVASNYSFIWNGVTSSRKDDVHAKFEAIAGDSTKMNMTISGIIPSSDEDLQLVVDIASEGDEIHYQGKADNPYYDLTVSGIYFNSRSSVGHYFKLKCEYNVVKEDLNDKTYTFNFKKGCTAAKVGDATSVTIDGSEYDYNQLTGIALKGMTDLYAEKDSAVQLSFSNNGKLTFDLLNQAKGETTVTNLMTIKYWLSKNSNEIILEFTKAQALSFIQKFLKTDAADDDIEKLFTKYEDEDKYILRAICGNNGKFTLMLNVPYNANAMTLFANGRLAEIKDDLFQKQVTELLKKFQETPAGWGMQFVSE